MQVLHMISLLNNNMKKIALILSLLLAFNIHVMAQPGFDDDVDDVPVDAGASLLAAAAVVQGIRKIRKTKDNSK
jgi:hypothetical protein